MNSETSPWKLRLINSFLEKNKSTEKLKAKVEGISQKA